MYPAHDLLLKSMLYTKGNKSLSSGYMKKSKLAVV